MFLKNNFRRQNTMQLYKKIDKRANFTMTKEQRKEMHNQFESVVLTDQEVLMINQKVSENVITDYHGLYHDKNVSKELIIESIYKCVFHLKLPTLHLAHYLNMKANTLNHKMKQIGWNYTPQESQQIAGKKSRNYGDILRKSRKTRMTTLLDKGDLSGSIVESVSRSILNEELGLRLPEDCEVIVGVSNRNIITPYEVDIPIIIVHKNTTHKFAVEFNGVYCHTSEQDNSKKHLLNAKGWHYLTVEQCGNSKTQREDYGSIEEQITKICDDIFEIITKKIK